MDLLCKHKLQQWYLLNFEKKLKGRYILLDSILPLIRNLSIKFKKEITGYSENKIPIYKITIGTGAIKILIWTQMHGNESTGTKVLFDLFKFFDTNSSYPNTITKQILAKCTIEFIPLLNPDGSIHFTRENANNIDLNRDAVARKAVESRILHTTVTNFKPKFCFNLHDQRSIFSVKGTNNLATLSFLAPSEDLEKTLTTGRKETMSVIVAMNKLLQQIIPNQIGRYTDNFYPTATGDNFQKSDYNTILIEAGHFKEDYNREITRKFNFYALLQGLYFIATAKNYTNYKPYFTIPNSDTKFLDIIYKNANLVKNGKLYNVDIGVQLKFKVLNGKLIMYKQIEKTGDLSNYFTHNQINAENLDFEELELSNS